MSRVKIVETVLGWLAVVPAISKGLLIVLGPGTIDVVWRGTRRRPGCVNGSRWEAGDICIF